MTRPRQPRQNREHLEQCAFFRFVRHWGVKYPALNWVHSIPNGANLSPAQRGKITAEGRTAGVWDAYCPFPHCLYKYASGHIPHRFTHCAGLYIEFKVGKNGLTVEQEAFRAMLEPHGYTFRVCYSWIEAAQELGKYIGINDVDYWAALGETKGRTK